MILPLMLASVSTAGAQTASIQDVAWLQGCWELRDGDRVVEERWTPPRAGSMLGVGRTTRGEKLVEHEFIVLTEHDGRLAYEAHPPGLATTTTRLLRSSGVSCKLSPDFAVQGPRVHGIPGLVHLFGIESPGLTASLALAGMVLDELH